LPPSFDIYTSVNQKQYRYNLYQACLRSHILFLHRSLLSVHEGDILTLVKGDSTTLGEQFTYHILTNQEPDVILFMT
jgi:hypothetical protein